MSKHTDGVWLAVPAGDGHYVQTENPRGPIVAAIRRSSGMSQDEECANARIIALAPKMIEAMQAFCMIDPNGNRKIIPGSHDRAFANLLRVLALAEPT